MKFEYTEMNFTKNWIYKKVKKLYLECHKFLKCVATEHSWYVMNVNHHIQLLLFWHVLRGVKEHLHVAEPSMKTPRYKSQGDVQHCRDWEEISASEFPEWSSRLLLLLLLLLSLFSLCSIFISWRWFNFCISIT